MASSDAPGPDRDAFEPQRLVAEQIDRHADLARRQAGQHEAALIGGHRFEGLRLDGGWREERQQHDQHRDARPGPTRGRHQRPGITA